MNHRWFEDIENSIYDESHIMASAHRAVLVIEYKKLREAYTKQVFVSDISLAINIALGVLLVWRMLS